MKAFVAGEGPHEIGKWSEPHEYRSTSMRSDGVLAEVVRKRHDVTVVGGCLWKQVRKFKAGNHASAEERTLRGIMLHAEESDADVVFWVRDSDGDPDRVKDLRDSESRVRSDHPDLRLHGLCAEPCIEAWVVGMPGKHASPETMSAPALKKLAAKHSIGTEAEMLEVVRHHAIDPRRNPSLHQWFSALTL